MFCFRSVDLLAMASLTAFFAGCPTGPVVDDGGISSRDDGGSTDSGAPPALTVPNTITVAEGRSTTFSVESNVAFVVTASDGLIVTVDGDTVDVIATLNTIEGTLTVSAPDHETLSTTVTVDVTPLAFSRLTWTSDGPSTREHGALVVSDDGQTIYVIGGSGYPNGANAPLYNDGWVLDVETNVWTAWTLSGDPLPPAGSMRVAHPPGDVAYLYGGYGDDFNSLDGLYAVTLSTGVVTALQQDTPPPARSLHAFAYDDDTRTFITYGGLLRTPNQQAMLDDMWLGKLNPAGTSVRWEQFEGTTPPARYGMYFGFDDAARSLTIYSGGGIPAPSNPVNAHDDAWTLELDPAPLWFKHAPSGPDPIGRRNGCGIVDPVTHALYIYGGTPDGQNGTPGFFALDLVDAPRFVEFERPDTPPLRSSGFGAPLPGGGFVCGFGNDDLTFQDLFFFR